MSNQNNSTRLGGILVDRGVITRQQLREAIEIQQARRELLEKNGLAASASTPIGELLIELGFINRQQLVQTLSWQQRLRKATLAMSFVAPLLTAACGGGGSTTTTGGNNKTEVNSSESSLVVQSSSSQVSLISSSSSSVNSLSSSSVSSQPFLSSASQSSSSAISLSSASSSSQSSSVAPISGIDGPVFMKWSVPSKRENGELLEVDEIGGYELRYKTNDNSNYTTVIIAGGHIDSYYFNHLEGDLAFEIAAYDTNGLYSRFVPIQPQVN